MGYVLDSLLRFDVSESTEVFPFRQNPPEELGTSAPTSNRLYFEGIEFRSGKVYAPSVFNPGSSIYHWDEEYYPRGDPNSLLTPSITNGESNHVLGELTCDLLLAIGYPVRDSSLCGTDLGQDENSNSQPET